MMILMLVLVLVLVSMRMAMAMAVLVVMVVIVVMRMFMIVAMIMVVGQMDIELHSGDAGFFLTRDMEVIIAKTQFLQLVLELMRIDAEVQQRSHKHIAADAAEDVQIKCFHRDREFICP